MRPVLGEMGTFDAAMLTEYKKGKTIVYEGYNDVICTYELDDTPPFSCNDEARKVALQIALLLNANIIEEMHVSRKNYLDGSVPCGFQRTMILGTDGYITLKKGKKIRIDILSLEEEAARKIKTEDKTNFYRLDRLGIPLVEVTTKPDISTPEECRECAERIGLLLWVTNVKKVIGSIRQDINVSIKSGTRIEIKGVQKLSWIPLLINHEISRQLNLIEIRKELKNRKINEDDIPLNPVDLTSLMAKSSSKFIANGIKSGKKLYGFNFKGFKDLFGKELTEDYRFGTEISSKVKVISGIKGIIHSDEKLEKYNLSREDVKKIQNKLDSKDNDCFVLILGTVKELSKAAEIIINRIKLTFKGVPPETRKALENGTTEFLRELHGGARLYPDTDSQAIMNSVEEIRDIQSTLPKYPWDIIDDYAKKYNIEKSSIKDLIFNGKLSLFDNLIEIYPNKPSIVINTILNKAKAIRREGKDVGNIGKEAIEDIMRLKADSPHLTIEQSIEQLNLKSLSVEELKKIIEEIVINNLEIIKEKEMRSMGPLMGEVMKTVRGKIDGEIVSKELKLQISSKLKEMK
jgi:glutamyl-tRNA(Gln) amidotransferase subunit E